MKDDQQIDYGKWQAAEGALKKSEEFFGLLVNAVKDYAIFALDSRGYIQSWNQGAKNLKGYEEREIIGKHFSIFYSDEDKARRHPEWELEQAIKNGRYEEEGWRIKKSGEKFWANVIITALKDSTDTLIGFAKITRDLTERKLAEEERYRIIREQAIVTERQLENKRATFLAEASTILAASLDFRKTLKILSEFAVREFSDLCKITIINLDQSLESITSSSNFASEDSIEDLQDFRMIFNNKKTFKKIKRNKSYLFAPILYGDKILGAMAFVSKDLHDFNDYDISLVSELGRRAGISIDNAFHFEESQRAIQSRDEFMSIASHELKTPLTSMKLQNQIRIRDLKRNHLSRFSSDKLLDLMENDERQLNRLIRLVDDMLDISRLRTGKLVLTVEEFNLETLISQIITNLGPQLEELKINVKKDIEDSIIGYWDKFRIEQVIINLLSNAIKYGEGKPIKISAWKDEKFAHISVQDNGMGIAENDQERIFGQFERAVSNYSISGLGVGLYITQEERAGFASRSRQLEEDLVDHFAHLFRSCSESTCSCINPLS